MPSFYRTTSTDSMAETERLITRRSLSDLRKSNSCVEITEPDEPLDSELNGNPFLDPVVAEYWTKIYENCHYECRFHFDPLLEWTKDEEYQLLRTLERRVTLLACFMFVGLQIDRGNIGQAVSDNMLDELGLTTQDYNYGNMISKVAFLLAEIPSGLISKKLGPDIWLPIQMIIWSVVAMTQAFITGRYSFFLTRALIAFLEGGFIPEMVLWLSYFFTSEELSIKLAWFWSSAALTQVATGLMAFVILRMRGVFALSGWRWLFLIEGFVTLIIGIISYVEMVPSAVETKSKINPDGWFSYREEKIVVNRVLRDDPSKGDMHNRQALSYKLLWKALLDYDLWPVYIIGFVAFIPVNTIATYLTLNLKEMKFDTFTVNLLTIPYNIFHILFLLAITRCSELLNERCYVILISPIWALPCLAVLRWWSGSMVNRVSTYIVTTILLSQPYIHAINVAWVSRNSNSIRTRSISSALYNMFNQAGGIIAANMYRPDDAPRYDRGNEQLFYLSIFTVLLILATKSYYIWRNHEKEKIWSNWDYNEKELYIKNTKDEGNKRLDFRFTH